ncbi:hypothetical protein KM043_013994 [Ampulex compressa]|nr:hypothetical protein KM043_013994 [Ampulex compressa]
MVDVLNNPTIPHVPNTNDIGRLHRPLLMHPSNEPLSDVPPINPRSFDFSTATLEQSRIITDNISFTIDEIRLLLENARGQPGISLTSLLNIQRLQNQIQRTPSNNDSYVITVEDQPMDSTDLDDHSTHDHHHETTATDNLLNNIREAANEVVESQSSNNSRRQTSTERPWITSVLLATFNHANNVLKREISKQHNRSWISLLIIACYIAACIVFINFMFKTHIFSPYTEPVTIWELLWSVIVTDFVLKLITIILKIILTCLPVRLLAFQKRGKYYLMTEATSQLYRCVAPVQPWLYYLLEAYQGPEKILGVILTFLYTVSKVNDFLYCAKLFRKAAKKLLQNVILGIPPTKEQLRSSGGICAICHEEYSMPRTFVSFVPCTDYRQSDLPGWAYNIFHSVLLTVTWEGYGK